MQAKERSPLASYFLLGVGVLFTVLGIYSGECGRIFDKAIMICLQCIGIG